MGIVYGMSDAGAIERELGRVQCLESTQHTRVNGRDGKGSTQLSHLLEDIDKGCREGVRPGKRRNGLEPAGADYLAFAAAKCSS